MTKVPAHEVKRRTKMLADWFQTYNPYTHKLGEIQEVLVTEVAHDNKHYVGHNKFYEQVLIPKNDAFMGRLLKVKIIETKKHCLIGDPLNSGVCAALAPRILDISSIRISINNAVPCTIIALIIAVFIRILWLSN